MAKKSKKKVVIPRVPIQKIKPEQVHKSLKEYDRAKVKKELKEILKDGRNELLHSDPEFY